MLHQKSVLFVNTRQSIRTFQIRSLAVVEYDFFAYICIYVGVCAGLTFTSFQENQTEKMWIKSVLWVAASVGFLFQMFQMSIVYFAYSTSTRSRLITREHVVEKDIALCIRYRELLNLSRLRKESGIIYPNIREEKLNITAFKKLEGLLSIKQIFQFTPSPQDIIESCLVRPDDFRIESRHGIECLDSFNITRFFTQDRVCYNIKELRKNSLQQIRVSTASFYADTIWQINFNQQLKTAKSIRIIGYSGYASWYSRKYSLSIPDVIDNGSKKYNFLWVKLSTVEISFLESPYDTHCVEMEDFLPDFRRRNCLVEALKPKAATWEIYWEREGYGNLHPLALNDLQNKSLRESVTRISGRCSQLYERLSCHTGYTKTMTMSGWRTGGGSEHTSLKVAYETPIDADVEITSLPNMKFVDFFVYICSCLSTWFGISFMSVYRFKYVTRCYRFNKRPIRPALANRSILFRG